jgi:hypothetical protein
MKPVEIVLRGMRENDWGEYYYIVGMYVDVTVKPHCTTNIC